MGDGGGSGSGGLPRNPGAEVSMGVRNKLGARYRYAQAHFTSSKPKERPLNLRREKRGYSSSIGVNPKFRTAVKIHYVDWG